MKKNQLNINNTTKALAFVVLFFKAISASTQINLIYNPSFEQFTTCPNLVPKSYPDFWYPASKAQNFFTSNCAKDACGFLPIYCCTGAINFQNPRTGNNFIGNFFLANSIGSNRRHYHQTKLKDSLKQGKRYYIEFFVNNCAGSNYACNNLSALLTKTAVYVDTIATPYGVLPATAQIYNYGNPIIYDTLNWVKVSSIYKALGGELFLTLGNFKNDNQTNYKNVSTVLFNSAAYNIDDVSVYEINDSFCLKADAGKDTTIKIGDSVFIGSYTNGIDTLRWLNVNTNTVIDSLQPGFWVKPIANTTYILYQIVNGCPSSDTINVIVQPLPLKFTSFAIFPSLGGVRGGFATSNEINVSHFNIQRSIDGIHFETIGKVVAKNNSYNDYSFIDDKLPNTNDQLTIYYRLQSVDKDGKLNYLTTKQITINKKQETVLVFPNPAKDVVNVYCKEGIKEVRVFNVLGKKVYQQSINSINQLSLNINHYLKGSYIIEITTKNGKVFYEKLLVQ